MHTWFWHGMLCWGHPVLHRCTPAIHACLVWQKTVHKIAASEVSRIKPLATNTPRRGRFAQLLVNWGSSLPLICWNCILLCWVPAHASRFSSLNFSSSPISDSNYLVNSSHIWIYIDTTKKECLHDINYHCSTLCIIGDLHPSPIIAVFSRRVDMKIMRI